MDLSTLLSGFLTGAQSEAESPPEASDRDPEGSSVSTVYECRSCGTNVSEGHTSCPVCDGDDIVTYSID